MVNSPQPFNVQPRESSEFSQTHSWVVLERLLGLDYILSVGRVWSPIGALIRSLVAFEITCIIELIGAFEARPHRGYRNALLCGVSLNECSPEWGVFPGLKYHLIGARLFRFHIITVSHSQTIVNSVSCIFINEGKVNTRLLLMFGW